MSEEEVEAPEQPGPVMVACPNCNTCAVEQGETHCRRCDPAQKGGNYVRREDVNPSNNDGPGG